MDPNNPYAPPSQGAAYPPLGAPGQGTHLNTEGYEFDDIENVLIGKTAKRVKIWGIISYVIGILGVLGVVVVLFVPMEMRVKLLVLAGATPLLITHLAIAHFYVTSGNALQRVVDTQGDDVQHLLEGIQKLTLAFKIEAIVMAVSMMLGFIVGIVMAATGTEFGGMNL